MNKKEDVPRFNARKIKHIVVGLIIFLLCFWLMLGNVWAQDDYAFQERIDGKHDWFEIDQLGNLYLIDNFVLTQVTPSGERKTFSDDFQSTVGHVDISDPMNILVYYATDNRLLFLDKNLVQRNEIFFLDQLKIEEPTVVAKSGRNVAWVFDPYYFSVVAFDNQSEVQLETKDLSKYAQRPSFPNFLVEANRKLIVNIPSTGILLFDDQAAFIKKLIFPNVKAHDLQLLENRLLYRIGENLFCINLETTEQELKPLPVSCKQCRVQSGKLFCSDGKGISIYKILP